VNTKELESYWSERYKGGKTGWDIGHPSTPIKQYVDQLVNKDIKILIPGAGNAYEAEYLHKEGFKNVYVLDISKLPLDALSKRVPTFSKAHLLKENFFEHSGQYDLIIEQTFFCSFMPTLENRSNYAAQMSNLLKLGGKLVGLWFKHTFDRAGGRPFGGTREEYLSYLTPHLKMETFGDCYNSIRPRAGNELFGIFVKQ